MDVYCRCIDINGCGDGAGYWLLSVPVLCQNTDGNQSRDPGPDLALRHHWSPCGPRHLGNISQAIAATPG